MKKNYIGKRTNMKHFKALVVLIALALSVHTASAQISRRSEERYGNTLNLGLGTAYFHYLGQSVPFFTANYEFEVARNFTLAPYIGFASFRSYDSYYWHGTGYYYNRTIVPVGVKGTYYFDKLLGAGPKWDFYLAGSLGFTYVHDSWPADYYGDRSVATTASPLYFNLHVGAEYRINKKLGLFADLSTGTSTFGLAVHNLH